MVRRCRPKLTASDAPICPPNRRWINVPRPGLGARRLAAVKLGPTSPRAASEHCLAAGGGQRQAAGLAAHADDMLKRPRYPGSGATMRASRALETEARADRWRWRLRPCARSTRQECADSFGSGFGLQPARRRATLDRFPLVASALRRRAQHSPCRCRRRCDLHDRAECMSRSGQTRACSPSSF